MFFLACFTHQANAEATCKYMFTVLNKEEISPVPTYHSLAVSLMPGNGIFTDRGSSEPSTYSL